MMYDIQKISTAIRVDNLRFFCDSEANEQDYSCHHPQIVRANVEPENRAVETREIHFGVHRVRSSIEQHNKNKTNKNQISAVFDYFFFKFYT